MKKKHVQRFLKLLFDYFFSLITGVFLIPVILVAMLVVRIKSPEAPAIFRQERIGYKSRKFTILKIRSMTEERDENGERLPDEARLKKWGKVIRKLNIDELTQIIHIFKGEMSWIGPRPLLEKEMVVMSEQEQELRQSVRPGITGWEAIHESESTSRRTMAEYDLYYVENWSLWLDIKIIFKTVAILLLGRRPDDEYRAPKIEAEAAKTPVKSEEKANEYINTST